MVRATPAPSAADQTDVQSIIGAQHFRCGEGRQREPGALDKASSLHGSILLLKARPAGMSPAGAGSATAADSILSARPALPCFWHRHACQAFPACRNGPRPGRRPTPRPTNGHEKRFESKHRIKWEECLRSSPHDWFFNGVWFLGSHAG